MRELYRLQMRRGREAQEVLRRFNAALSMSRCHVTKLERIYNAKLEERFAAAKETFRKMSPKASCVEAIMFHGTRAENVDK